MRPENRLFPRISSMIVAPIINLWARLYVGMMFFSSGLSKSENWNNTVKSFETEWALPILSPNFSAVLCTAGELILPVILIVGFCTRFSAAGLFVVVTVIEFIVFSGSGENTQHYYLFLVLGFLIGYGGNKLSLDYFLRRKEERRSRFA